MIHPDSLHGPVRVRRKQDERARDLYLALKYPSRESARVSGLCVDSYFREWWLSASMRQSTDAELTAVYLHCRCGLSQRMRTSCQRVRTALAVGDLAGLLDTERVVIIHFRRKGLWSVCWCGLVGVGEAYVCGDEINWGFQGAQDRVER